MLDVLNANNQCHDVKNPFVTDGTCMASSTSSRESGLGTRDLGGPTR